MFDALKIFVQPPFVTSIQSSHVIPLPLVVANAGAPESVLLKWTKVE
jgi:hypothetical protein